MPNINKIFGKLKIISSLRRKNPTEKVPKKIYLCRCECGNTVKRTLYSLTLSKNKGYISSCGCTKKPLSNNKIAVKARKLYQERKDKGYSNFISMKRRGIEVDSRWKGPQAWNNFLKDLGPKPSPKHILGRKDLTKSYTSNNVEWTTSKKQILKRKETILIKGKTIEETAILLNLNPYTISSRVKNYWTENEILKGSRNENRRHIRQAILNSTDESLYS